MLVPLALALTLGVAPNDAGHAASAQASKDEGRFIHLNGLRFDPRVEVPSIPERLRHKRTETIIYHVVQFTDRIDAQMRSDLTATGAVIFHYIPDNAFLVRADPASIEQVRRLPAVRWVGPYEPAYKLSPLLAREFDRDLQRWIDHVTTGSRRPVPRIDTSAVVPVSVLVIEEARSEEVGRALEAAGAARLERPQRGHVFRAAVPRAALDRLAQEPGILWIDRDTPSYVMNDAARWVIQSGNPDTKATPVHDHGLTGVGQLVTLADTGIDYRHSAFADNEPSHCGGMSTPCLPGPEHRKVTDYYVPTGVPNNCPTPTGSCADLQENHDPNHGTYTSSQIIGDAGVLGSYDGTPDQSGGAAGPHDGEAYGAKAQIQDISYDGRFVYPPTDLHDLFQDAFNRGSFLHSNSWGSFNNQYTIGSMQIDDFMWEKRNQGFLAFFAAGNLGYEGHSGSVGTEANAKNTITVGGSQNGTRENFVFCYPALTACSSRGPAGDGRIKPDLLAPGQEVWSAHGCQTNQDPTGFCDDYFLGSGTSAATPNVAAAAALTRQYYQEGWYPTGSHQTVNGLAPSAALLKATLINSAVEVTGSGVCENDFNQTCSLDSECPGSHCFMGTSGYGFQNDSSFPNSREEFYPNNTQGWGRILLDDAMFFEGDARSILLDDTGDDRGVMKDETRTYQLPISDTTLPIKVALVWTDAPALSGAFALVDDLDLVVVAPDGATTYRGNKYQGFNLAQSEANATEADRINNIETVLIRTGVQSGVYSVRVTGYNLPMGLGPDVRHPYALVMTGGIARSRGQVSLDKTMYQPGSTVTVKVVDPDSNLNPSAPDTVTVQMTSTLETTPETITLNETGPGSTVFSGTILMQQSGSATSDGKLQVLPSDTITATYFDAQDGFGGGSNRMATATADGNGPLISAVTATDVRLNRATITWTTDERASSTVHYGTSTPPGSGTTDELRVTGHSVTLLGLAAGTTYYFDVSSTDAVGNTATANNGGSYFQFTTPAPPPVNFEWPMFQNNDSRQGRSSSKFNPPLTLRWSTGTYTSFYLAGLRGPVIAGGKLYTTTADGLIRARNPLTGAQIWESTVGSQGPPSIPTVADGVLYYVVVESGFGRVIAANSSGAVLWSNPGSFIAHPLPVVGGLVFASTSLYSIRALRTTDGSFAWTAPAGEVMTPLTVVGGEIVYGSVNTVIALDAADGHHLWTTTTDGWVTTAPVYGNDKVFVGTDAGRIYALDASNGVVAWSVSGYIGVQNASLTFDGANLYFADPAGYHAVNALNGAPVWDRTAPNGGGPLAYAFGHVYAVGGDGVLRAMRANDGIVVDQKTLGSGQFPSAPSVWNGWVFVTDANNATYGFQGVQVDTDADGDPDDTDCAPTNPAVSHGATEGVTSTTLATCFDGLDNDCDGVVDLDCAIDVSPDGQVFFVGSVTCGGINDLAATSSNNVYECLREEGAPSFRMLITVWTYSTSGAPAGTNYDLRVEGFRNSGANDVFNFSSSTRGTSGTCGIGEGESATIASVANFSDTGELKAANLGIAQSTYCVRVEDSNQTGSENQPDTLTLDRLFVFPTPVATGDYPASGDVGTVTSGSYVSTQRSEDTRETIREELSGGSYRLWRTWQFQAVPAGSGHKLHLEGFRTVGQGGKLDDFKFYYSTNPLSWSPTNPLTGFTLINNAVISSTSDPAGGIDSSSFGGSGLSGVVYIRVIDAQKSQTANWQNTLNIDHIAIKTVP